MLIGVEFKKLKRTKMMLISVITIFLVTLIVLFQGSRSFQGERYFNTLGWLTEGALSLFTFYIFPPLFSLLGSFIICREAQYDTLKNILIVPISKKRLITVKLAVTFLTSMLLCSLLFLMVMLCEIAINQKEITLEFVAVNLRHYLLQGLGCFVAITPIISVVTILSRGYWISVALAIVYSFVGVFAVNSPFHSVYPISAVFEFSGAHPSTSAEYMVAVSSLAFSMAFSLVIILLSHKKGGD